MKILLSFLMLITLSTKVFGQTDINKYVGIYQFKNNSTKLNMQIFKSIITEFNKPFIIGNTKYVENGKLLIEPVVHYPTRLIFRLFIFL